MSKYEPLEQFLGVAEYEQIPMTFAKIEELIGDKLPQSARKHRAWWSNNPSNSVITHAWLNAGYKTENVDLEGETLVFRKVGRPLPSPPAGGAVPPDSGRRRPFVGFMSGFVTILPGVDLTEPVDPDWGDRDDAGGLSEEKH